MQLPRDGRKWLNLETAVTDADGDAVTGARIVARFDGGPTVPADDGGTWPRWLLDGPDLDPDMPEPPPEGVTPIQITGRTVYRLYVIGEVEVEVATGTIYLA